MKLLYLFIIALFITSCQSNTAKERTTVNSNKPAVKAVVSKPANSAVKTVADTADLSEQENDYADYYVVVTDTGKNYADLRGKMFDLHKTSKLTIDTMRRFYDSKKDLIKLPDNDEDEIFAGDYFQRRNISNTLSLEYLQPYLSSSKNKTIALVAGIYETKEDADSVLKSIKTPNAFTVKAHIYEGCLH